MKTTLYTVLGALLALGSGGLLGLFQRLRDYPHDAGTNMDPDASHTQDG